MTDAFIPQETFMASVTTSSANFELENSYSQMRVFNQGGAVVFCKLGFEGVVATANDMPLPSGTIEVFSKGNYTHVALMTVSGTSTVYITGGKGL